VHEDDAEDAAGACAVDATFAGRHRVGDDLEVLPIPGHTAGATALLWEADGARFLFTGDPVYLQDGEWVAAVLGGSDRERYIGSLELLRGLEFDALVPWAASAAGRAVSRQEPAEARRRLGAIIDRLRHGEDR
jgi:glyoxylase-like metal-dependent hydrolase (beta-lactamase superfamily II)